jgi:hypothetical protein
VATDPFRQEDLLQAYWLKQWMAPVPKITCRGVALMPVILRMSVGRCRWDDQVGDAATDRSLHHGRAQPIEPSHPDKLGLLAQDTGCPECEGELRR